MLKKQRSFRKLKKNRKSRVEIPEEEVKPLETEDDFVDSAEEEETKLPELEIPEAMKNVGMENPLHTEIPKAPDICLPGMQRRF